jgi:hypothetical protein
VELIDAGGARHTFEGFDAGTQAIHPVRLEFGQTFSVISLHLSVESLDEGSPAHVHLWDVIFE